MSRKIFNYDDMDESKIVSSLNKKSELYKNTISACGCLFYKVINNKVYLLLISYSDPKWNKLDDFGGQIDDDDDTVIDAICREVSEETNKKISKKKLLKLINKNNHKIFYNNFAKYYNYVIEVDDDFFEDTSVFGTKEKTDDIERTIDWYEFSEYKSKMAQRLVGNKKLVGYLEKLEPEKSESTFLF